ncbi:restriction endonuclease subunit S [Alteromonas macleodii]|uniref:restriction endonuclease subunit S n=1 Tax=Alteromonas macleodii TaxID=28108 RepID=UPI0030CAEBE1
MSDKKTVKFGDICREVKLTTKDPIADGYERYIGLEHLDSGSLKIKRWGMIAEDNPSFTRVFKKGHILFGKRRPYLKKAAIAEFDGICSGDIIVLDVQDILNKDVAYQVFRSNILWDWAIRTSSGSLSPRTKYKELAKLEITFNPDRLEVVSPIFRKVSANQELYENAVASIRNLRRAIDSLLASESDLVSKTCKLKDVSHHMVNGVVGKSAHAYQGGTIPYIMGKNVGQNKLLLDDLEYVSKDFHESNSRSILRTGDVLVVQSGHIGTACVVPEALDGANCHALIIIRPNKEKVCPRFLSYYLNSRYVQHKLKALHVGTTIKHINTGDLRQFSILVPNLDAQRRIVEALSYTDTSTQSILDRFNLSETISDRIFNEILE